MKNIAVVTGGREHVLTDDQATWLKGQLLEGFEWLLHGDALGVDRACAAIASSSPVRIKAFPYRSECGRAGGAVRNAEMAAAAIRWRDRQRAKGREADAVLLAFPGGRGTADMIRKAKDAGMVIRYAPTAAPRQSLLPV
ncbi:MAG TPA: hypothetical protein VIG24_10425 [Acidimicrobiia bacterium]